jgi:hypothetical protein
MKKILLTFSLLLVSAFSFCQTATLPVSAAQESAKTTMWAGTAIIIAGSALGTYGTFESKGRETPSNSLYVGAGLAGFGTIVTLFGFAQYKLNQRMELKASGNAVSLALKF